MAVTATGVWNCRSSSIPTDLFSSHQDFLVPLADQELKVSGFLVQKFILFTSHFCRKGEMGRRDPLSGQNLDQQWHLVVLAEGSATGEPGTPSFRSTES